MHFTLTPSGSGDWKRSQRPEPQSTDTALSTSVGSIAPLLEPGHSSLSSNQIHLLQHISLDEPATAVLRIVLEPLGLMEAPAWTDQARWERQWAALLKGMSLCAGLHTPSVSLGEALARINWPPDRFTSMIEASRGPIRTYVEWAARDLESVRQPANWDDVRRLIFKRGEHVRQARRQVTNDYFRTIYAIQRKRS